MVRPATRTGQKAIETEQRLARVLALRMNGWNLREIGEQEGVTAQRIHQLILLALTRLVSEASEEIRQLELARLDDLQIGVWERALNGDVAAIDRVLAIMVRRARLLGLDPPPVTVGVGVFGDGFDPPPPIRVKIIGPDA